MLKKLLIIIAVLSLASCSSKTKKDDFKIEDKSADQTISQDTPESYQTVDSAGAAALDQQTQAQIQEVEVQDRVLFEYNSASLTEDAKKILDTQVAWLKSDPNIRITVEGHCDERGTREYNIALGEKRANATKIYLTANGIDVSRIKTVSYGKERPAFFGASEDVMAKNRRAVTVMN